MNPRYIYMHTGFRDQLLKPLGQPSTLLNYLRTPDRTRIEQLKNLSLFELREQQKPRKYKVFGYMASTLPHAFRVRRVTTTSLLLHV